MNLETIKTETLKLRRMELLELVQFVVEALRACWGFGFRGKKRQFFDETRRENGNIALAK